MMDYNDYINSRIEDAFKDTNMSELLIKKTKELLKLTGDKHECFEIIYDVDEMPTHLIPIPYDSISLSDDKSRWIQYKNSGAFERHINYTQILKLDNRRYFREDKLKVLID